jgi:predicted HicB family RNase H-like nuclease
MKRNKKGGIYAYLEASGILEHGSHEQIQEVRRQYWKTYRKEWHKRYTQGMKSFVIRFSPYEHQKIAEAAARHKRSINSYLRATVIGYSQQKLIISDPTSVREILSQLNLIYYILRGSLSVPRLSKEGEVQILSRLEEIEKSVIPQLKNPKTFETHFMEVLRDDPQMIERLLANRTV